MSSPFDEAKYNALLKGLEITEVKWSYVKSQSDVVRFDSYYYSKEFLSDEDIIAHQSNKSLKELNADLLSFGAYSLNNFVEYKDSGIPFIRGVNMKDGVLDFSDTLYIDETAHKLLWKSEVKPNTILLSMSGTIGDVAIAMPDYKYPMNSNQDIAKITLKDGLNPFYLYAFLRSKYGQNFLKREARGSVQQHVFLSQMENIRVPLLTDDFQQKIESLVKSAHAKLADSKSIYAQAEDMLLSELGLKDWQPKNESVSVKKFSDFTASNRLDAEYYQRKYDEIENAIKAYKGGYFTLRDCVKSYSTGYPFDSKSYVEDGYKLIRITNIKSPYLDLSNAVSIPQKDVMLSPRDVVNENDILISMSGTIGNSCVIPAKTKAVINQRILKITPKNYNPMVLSLLINSILCKMLFERIGTGGVQVNISSTDMFKILIPILPQKIHEQIAAKIQKSFALRAESKRLLEEAKKMVETEIEQGKDAVKQGNK